MNDVRPIVARARKDRTPLYFAIGAALAAILLFVALDSRRRALQESESDAAPLGIRAESVPALVLPDSGPTAGQANPATAWPLPGQLQPQAQLAPIPASRPARAVQVRVASPDAPYVPPPPVCMPPQGPMTDSAAPVQSPLSAASAAQGAGTDGKLSGGRVLAGRFENPSSTIPQGTLVSAVLETGLDSTGAGLARALVTRNVYGFDGTQLLIPRGSRLYGSYEAGVEQGQKRALIRWTRLLRPDGVTINLDSPASDPLGRVGVPGKVDSHFLQRFGNALLGSTVGLGNLILSRRVSPVVVVPGAQGAAPVMQDGGQIKPTLTVKPGARVSVFVQHDLDFSSVEDGQ